MQAGNKFSGSGILTGCQLGGQFAGTTFFPQAIYRSGFSGQLYALTDLFPASWEKCPILADPKIPLNGYCVDQAWPIQSTFFNSL